MKYSGAKWLQKNTEAFFRSCKVPKTQFISFGLKEYEELNTQMFLLLEQLNDESIAMEAISLTRNLISANSESEQIPIKKGKRDHISTSFVWLLRKLWGKKIKDQTLGFTYFHCLLHPIDQEILKIISTEPYVLGNPNKTQNRIQNSVFPVTCGS